MISGAPWSLSGIGVVIVSCTWLFVNYINSATISAKDATIETLRTERDDYKTKLSGATPDEAKARITALEAKIKDIEPRAILKDQKIILNTLISGLPNSASREVWIAYYDRCIDCSAYAVDFMHLFPIPPWSVNMITMGKSPLASPKGLALLVPDVTHLTVEANTIVTALTTLHVDFDLKDGAADIIPSMKDRPDTIILVTPKSAN